MNLDLLTYCRYEKYERRLHYLFVSRQTDKMRILNNLFPVLMAIWISPRNIICNKYVLIDMGDVDVNQEIVHPTPSPIRDPGLIDPAATVDPYLRSDTLHPGAEDLNEPLFYPPEPQMQKKVLKGYKPAYKGVEYYKH